MLASDFGFYPHLPWLPSEADYNCSGKTIDEWYETGEKRTLVGAALIMLGLTSLVAYILTILAMSDRVFLRQSCYLIMYFNCFLDMGNVGLGSIIGGVLFIRGSVFCTDRHVIFIVGALGLGCWSSSCLNCVALGLNRISHMTGKGKIAFEGNATFLWLLASSALFLYMMFFTRTVIFNSKMGAWFYYPIIKNIEQEAAEYVNWIHPFINVSTSVSLTLIYIFLCAYILWTKRKTTNKSWSRRDFMIFIQALIICSVTALAAYTYSYMQFFQVGHWFTILASVAYSLSSATPCVVYLTLNGTIKRRVVGFVRYGKWKAMRSSTSITPSPNREIIISHLKIEGI